MQDDGGAVHVSNTARKGIARLVGYAPPPSIISGHISRILGSRLPPECQPKVLWGIASARRTVIVSGHTVMNGVLGV